MVEHYGIPSISATHRRSTEFRFDADTGNLTRMGLASGENRNLEFTYDNLQRLRSRQLSHGEDVLLLSLRWETLYGYRQRDADTTSLQVEWLTHLIGAEELRFRYEYDSIGQIKEWSDPVHGATHGYEYDGQNQLTREEIARGGDPHLFTYSYDTFGNIRERRHWRGPSHIVRSQDMRFSYDNGLWPDQLTGVSVNGGPTRHIEYDESGNPLEWHDGRRFTWERGRQLARIQGIANQPDVEFEYDVNGIRTSKRVEYPDGTYREHTFYTQGGRIVAERREFSDERVHTLEFFYDEAGRPLQVFFCNGCIIMC